jgi:iron-sulfur cluster repair protein YtfE (RIC family)
MATAAVNPLRAFEHSHTHLHQLAHDVRQLLANEPPRPGAAAREALTLLATALREELLEHFANEEEALFPFVREFLPEHAAAVDRLEAAHDGICGSIVRLAHLVARGWTVTRDAFVVFERFEEAYLAHSAEETELFETLKRAVDAAQQGSLSERLRGLG